MKKLLMYALSLAIAFSPLQAVRAQVANPAQDVYFMSAEDYEKEIGKVIYSLENIEDVLTDLDKANEAASRSIGKHVATQVYRRISAAVEMIGVISADPNISEETRAKATDALIGAVGSLYFQIIRHKGADKYDVEQIEKQISSLSRAKAFLREFVINDTTALVPTKPDGNRLMLTAEERVQREDLGRAVTHKVKEYVTLALGDPAQDTSTTETMRIMLKDHVIGPAIKIKQNRLAGQRGVAAFWMGSAIIFGAFPGLLPTGDFVGWMDGGRSDNSLIATGAIVFSVLFSYTLLKAKTIGKSLIRAMEDIIEILKDPNVELRRAGFRTWYDEMRLRGALKKVGEKLPPKGPGLAASLANDVRYLPHDIKDLAASIFNKVGFCKAKISPSK